MSAVTIKWHGDILKRALKHASGNGIHAAAVKLRDKLQEVVSVPNTGVSVKRTRDTSRGKKGSSYTIYPRPSRAGEPPRLRTGEGQRNIFAERVGNDAAKVGSRGAGIHLFYLEMGTTFVARRPWLVSTLLAQQEYLAKVALSVTKAELEALK